MAKHLDARQHAILAEMGIVVWAGAVKPTETTPPAQALSKTVRASPALSPVQAKQNPFHSTSALDTLTTPTSLGKLPLAAQDRNPSLIAPLAPAPTQAIDPLTLKTTDWLGLQQCAANCQACRLGQSRQRSIWEQFIGRSGAGEQADLMVIGEPPSNAEEGTGTPWSGAAYHLVHQMLSAADLLKPYRVFLTNIVKCRLPDGEQPALTDLLTCRAYLEQQIRCLQPKVLLVLGRLAGLVLTGDPKPGDTLAAMVHMRGKLLHFAKVPVVVSYAPSFLLRNPQEKAKAWQDLCLLTDTSERINNGPASAQPTETKPPTL